MPAKKRRSPQEKKHLSYSKDRRNNYGENDKSSRKNIARSKRIRLRAERRYRRQQLTAAVGPVDEDAGALVHDSATRPRNIKYGYWRKWPDSQLGLHIARSLIRRARHDSQAAGITQARIRKVLRNTAIDGEYLPWAADLTIEAESQVERP